MTIDMFMRISKNNLQTVKARVLENLAVMVSLKLPNMALHLRTGNRFIFFVFGEQPALPIH